MRPSAREVSKPSRVRMPSMPSTPKNFGAYSMALAWFRIMEAGV